MSTVSANYGKSQKFLENEILRNTKLTCHYIFCCAKENASKSISDLHDQAKSIFPRTSELIGLSDQNCRIQDSTDLLADVKLQTQVLLLDKTRLQVMSPNSMRFFAVECENREIAYFGFAKYQDTLLHENRLYRLHDSRNVYWKGFVRINNQGCSKQEIFATYDSIVRFMRFAETNRVLREFVFC